MHNISLQQYTLKNRRKKEIKKKYLDCQQFKEIKKIQPNNNNILLNISKYKMNLLMMQANLKQGHFEDLGFQMHQNLPLHTYNQTNHYQ